MPHAKQNIFMSFLHLLKIQYTPRVAGKLYDEHSHRDNLYGLSNMLSIYGIENAALRLDKEAAVLSEIEVPFIAFVG